MKKADLYKLPKDILVELVSTIQEKCLKDKIFYYALYYDCEYINKGNYRPKVITPLFEDKEKCVDVILEYVRMEYDDDAIRDECGCEKGYEAEQDAWTETQLKEYIMKHNHYEAVSIYEVHTIKIAS